jgi:hypothetical protein
LFPPKKKQQTEQIHFPGHSKVKNTLELASTSLSRVLTQDFFFLDLRRTVPYFYVLLKGVFTSVCQDSKLISGTMVVSGSLKISSPMAQRHPYQAHRRHPHTMGDAARAWFGMNPPVGRVVSPPPPNAIMSFFGCMHIVDYFVEYIHIYLTLY